MTEFVVLTEVNDWEGETWHVFLQWDGNEVALAHLSADIRRAGFDTKWDFPFDLMLQPLPESEVAVILAHADDDDDDEADRYMPTWAKASGQFQWVPGRDHEALEDALYKGGIYNYFVGGNDD